MSKENIRVLKEYNLNKGASYKDVPVFPVTKESAVITEEGTLSEKLDAMQEHLDNCIDSTEATEIILRYAGGQADFTGTDKTVLDLRTTNLTDITIADSETIQKIFLPETVVGLTIKNCPNIKIPGAHDVVLSSNWSNCIMNHIKYWTCEGDVGELGWYTALVLSSQLYDGEELPIYKFVWKDWNTVNSNDEQALSVSLLVELARRRASGLPITITGDFNFTLEPASNRIITEVSMEDKRKLTWSFGNVDDEDNPVHIFYNKIEVLPPSSIGIQLKFFIEGGSYLGDSLTKDFIITQGYGSAYVEKFLYTNVLSDIRIEGPQSSSMIVSVNKNPFELDAYRLRVTFKEVPTSDMLLRIGVKINEVWYNSDYKTFKAGTKTEVGVGDYIYSDLSIDDTIDYTKDIIGFCAYLTPDNIPVYAAIPILYYINYPADNVINKLCNWGPSQTSSYSTPSISLQSADKYSSRIYDTLSSNQASASCTFTPSMISQMGISLDEIFSNSLFDRTIFEQSNTPHYPLGLLETATIIKTRNSILNDPTFADYSSSESWQALPSEQESEDTFATLLNSIISSGSLLRYPAASRAVLFKNSVQMPITAWLPSITELKALNTTKCDTLLKFKYELLIGGPHIAILNECSPILSSTETNSTPTSAVRTLSFVRTGVASEVWNEGTYTKTGAAPTAAIIPFFAINNSN